MTTRLADNHSFGEKLLLAALGIATIGGPIVFGLMNAPQIRAQAAQATTAPLPSFEVASIKPHKPDSPGNQIMGTRILPGRYVATTVTLKGLVAFAYNVMEAQVSGGPSWIDSDRYDVDAREEEADAVALQKLPREQQGEQVGLRVQALLTDRCKLKVSHQTKELSVYELVVAKNGPKFHESEPNATSPGGTRGPDGHAHPGTSTMGKGEGDSHIVGHDGTMPSLARLLSGHVGRTVLDKTGLKGKYDLRLDFTHDQAQAAMFKGTIEGNRPTDSAPSPESSGPSIFTALQEQLGLKLVSTKGPVDVIVIEHIEKPSEN